MADKVTQTLFIPEVGMSFESEKAAWTMYNTYAGKVGFNIKKSDVKKREDGTIYNKHIVCSSQGYPKTKSSKTTTRTGCNARVQFSVSREGVWTVQKVVLDHNHYLASPNKRQKWALAYEKSRKYANLHQQQATEKRRQSSCMVNAS